MRHLVSFLLLSMLGLSVIAQSEFNKTTHKFGELGAEDIFYADFEVKNPTGRKVFVLRVDHEREITYRLSKKEILPDSTITIRLKYTPTETGKFNITVPVYVSDRMEAVDLKLKGEVVELPPNASPECPDFSGSETIAQQMSFELQVDVVDDATDEPIHKAKVRLIYTGRTYDTFETNRKGTVKEEVPLGYYYFIVTAEGYEHAERAEFVNRKNDRLEFRLKRSEPSFAEATEDEKDEDEEIVEEVEIVEKEVVEEVIDTTPHTGFDLRDYKQNNIIFLVDVSSSMNLHGKMDLLKASMLQLLDMLRPEDRVALVAYASDAEVLLDSKWASEDQKDTIEAVIREFDGDGFTAGGEGIRKAYRVAKDYFIEGGNNHIIIATDGKFNRASSSYTSTIKNGARKDITMSVVGIKNSSMSEESMREIAEMGKGRYIHIQDFEDAMNSLKDEIKIASRRQ